MRALAVLLLIAPAAPAGPDEDAAAALALARARLALAKKPPAAVTDGGASPPGPVLRAGSPAPAAAGVYYRPGFSVTPPNNPDLNCPT